MKAAVGAPAEEWIASMNDAKGAEDAGKALVEACEKIADSTKMQNMSLKIKTCCQNHPYGSLVVTDGLMTSVTVD